MVTIISEILAVIFFCSGLLVGLSVGKDAKKPLKIEKIAENKRKLEEKAVYDKQLEAIQTTLDNIDAYDGTGIGQKDIPYESEGEDIWT